MSARLLLPLTVAVLLAGCATNSFGRVFLQHPQTGQDVICRNAECVAKFEAHGYIRTGR